MKITGLDCVGPFIHRFFPINIVLENLLLVESEDVEGGLTIGPEHVKILVSRTDSGTNPLWIGRDDYAYFLWYRGWHS